MIGRAMSLRMLITLPLVVIIGFTIAAHGQRKQNKQRRTRNPLPLRQPGSPWADDPAAYNADPDFEKHARRPARRDYFKVLDYPPFVNAAEADAKKLVAGNLPVVGVAHKNVAKAYPIQVLGIHELCNDSIADEPIVASY